MQTDILIIGAGIAGCSLAAGLSRIGINYYMIEKRSQPNEQGAGIILQDNALVALSSLGIEAQNLLRPHVVTSLNLGNADNPSLYNFPINSNQQPCISLHREDLQQSLFNHTNPEYLTTSATLSHIEKQKGGFLVSLSNGNSIHCKLIVGADGIHSKARTQLLRKTQTFRSTNQVCWRFVLSGMKLSGKGYELHQGKLRLGLVPLSGERVYVFLVNHGISLQAAKQCKTSDFISIFREFGSMGSDLASKLETTSSHLLHPLVDADICWHNNDAIGIIGDAAHPITPNLGMGAALALEDSAVLCRLFDRHGLDACVFHHLQNLRQARVKMIKETSFWFGRTAHIESILFNKIKFGVLKHLPNHLLEMQQNALTQGFAKTLSRI